MIINASVPSVRTGFGQTVGFLDAGGIAEYVVNSINVSDILLPCQRRAAENSVTMSDTYVS
jgi:hypothetical protein